MGIIRQSLQNIQVEGGFSALDSFPQPHSPETYPELLLPSEIIQKQLSIPSVLILLINSESGRKEGNGWTRASWFDYRMTKPPIRMGFCVVEPRAGFPPSRCDERLNKEDEVTAWKSYPLIMRLHLFSGPLHGRSQTAQTINSIYFTLRAPVCVCCSFGLAFSCHLECGVNRNAMATCQHGGACPDGKSAWWLQRLPLKEQLNTHKTLGIRAGKTSGGHLQPTPHES